MRRAGKKYIRLAQFSPPIGSTLHCLTPLPDQQMTFVEERRLLSCFGLL